MAMEPDKAAFEKRLETELAQIEADLKRYEATVRADQRARSQWIDDLKAQLSNTRRRLDESKTTSRADWHRMGKDLERALRQIKEGLVRAKNDLTR